MNQSFHEILWNNKSPPSLPLWNKFLLSKFILQIGCHLNTGDCLNKDVGVCSSNRDELNPLNITIVSRNLRPCYGVTQQNLFTKSWIQNWLCPCYGIPSKIHYQIHGNGTGHLNIYQRSSWHLVKWICVLVCLFVAYHYNNCKWLALIYSNV